MAESTYITRRTQWKHYFDFCATHDVIPLPASVDTICLYLAYMADSFVYSSIQNYLSAVWVLHRVNGVPHVDIRDTTISFTLKGIRRVLGDEKVSAVPITVQDLKAIYSILDMSLSEDMAFWMSLIIGFRGLLRKSNLFEKEMALRVCDIQSTSWGVLLSLRRTKTIAFRERVLEIPLVSIPNSIFCVKFYIGCLLALVQHPSARSQFLSYVKGSKIIPCTYQWFSHKLSQACVRLGLNKYTSHSLRRGGATALADADIPLFDIKNTGDWKSMAVLLYLERSLDSRIAIDRRSTAIMFR